MKALYIDGPGKTVLRDLVEPQTLFGEVLLRIRIVGLCGTDLSTFRGMNPLASYPRIPGHEIGATIEEVDEGIPSEFNPGMDVTVSPYTSCGTCPACRQGRTNCCRDNQTLGVQREGALTEYIAIPWSKLLKSEDLSTRELALVEPLAVGFHAIDRCRVTANDTVVVLGCGVIGLGAIAGAAFRKARVIAVDIDDRKTAVAKKAGAKDVINSRIESLHERLEELTNGDGPTVMVEAVGLPLTFRSAVDEVSFAGRVVYIGYVKEPVTYETKYFVQKELDILGSRNAETNDFNDVIKMLRSRCFPVEDVITRTVLLENVGDALAAWSDNPQAFTKIQVAVNS